MGKYTNITEKEMTEFLTQQGFVVIQLPNTTEMVFGKRVDQDGQQLSLRVYTGIVPGQDSRDCGKDAIRVSLFHRNAQGKIAKLGGSKRVHRVVNWRKNLQNRLDNWIDNLPEHACSVCGSPMLVRSGKNGKFLGCSSYPDCTHTERI